MMDRFKPALYMVILFSLSIACCLSLDKGVVSALDNDRLAKVEDLLETVINKNQELEKRVEHLEAELLGQKIVNDELLKRLSELETEHETKQRVYENSDLSENDVYNGTQGGNKAVNDQTSQTYLWKEKEASPKVPKRNQHRHSKRLLDPPQTTPSVPITHRTVAFTAYMSADASGLGPGQGIIFDKVITNVGGGYHAPHGNFIAPTDGVYVFTLMAMEQSGQSEHLYFVKDGVDIAHVYVGSTSTFISTTGIITLSLSKGNEVWIRTPRASWHGTGSLHGVDKALFTSFSGWLLN